MYIWYENIAFNLRCSFSSFTHFPSLSLSLSHLFALLFSTFRMVHCQCENIRCCSYGSWLGGISTILGSNAVGCNAIEIFPRVDDKHESRSVRAAVKCMMTTIEVNGCDIEWGGFVYVCESVRKRTEGMSGERARKVDNKTDARGLAAIYSVFSPQWYMMHYQTT